MLLAPSLIKSLALHWLHFFDFPQGVFKELLYNKDMIIKPCAQHSLGPSDIPPLASSHRRSPHSADDAVIVIGIVIVIVYCYYCCLGRSDTPPIASLHRRSPHNADDAVIVNFFTITISMVMIIVKELLIIIITSIYAYLIFS